MTCRIATLDRLWTDADAPSIVPADRDAVAAVQSLLLGHGFSRMPTILARDCGIYGPLTIGALQSFQSDQNLPATGGIDRGTLQALARVPARSPVVSSAYAAFALDITATGLLRPATVTMQLEGAGGSRPPTGTQTAPACRSASSNGRSGPGGCTSCSSRSSGPTSRASSGSSAPGIARWSTASSRTPAASMGAWTA